MNIASILLVGMLFQSQTAQQPPKTTQSTAQTTAGHPTTFSSDELGLEFDYPNSWRQSKVKVKNDNKIVLTDPKTWHPPKTDQTTRFLVPMPGVDERGILEIFSAQFYQDEDTWQTVQRDINDKLKRTVLRQWTEELLGVPLLMTKIESKDKGVDLITETGLLYSQTPRKLIFRLTASPDNFDKADYQWRQAMQTMRTSSGKPLVSENPDRKLTAAELDPGTIHQVIWTAKPPAQQPILKGSVSTEATAGGKKVFLRTPTGWKISKNADGTFTLAASDLSAPAKLTVASDLDSDPAGKALLHGSGINLQAFSRVIKREEKGPFTNRAQAQVDTIFRRGYAGTKPLFSYDAAGAIGDLYWVLTWTGNDEGASKRDRKALDSLADVMSVEPGG